ncbi:MAG: hypothetical protein Solumvirus2_34 [Solumvirus sp.]|uniref:SKP1 component POZ domain-containing protein n=1 Tax=Solumvirus sp. TaxID=2487773 RepID=A0A3G5AGC1_9VIRU|nr:MAG: hypothetical protein Solumvirus2_34 [Solumvirus sp.]
MSAGSAAAADNKSDVKTVVGVNNTPTGVKGLDSGNTLSEAPLKLTSKDKKEFEVTQKQAGISTLIKTSLEADTKANEIPVPGVTGNILGLVVQYMIHHKGIEPPIVEKPLRSKVMKDVVSDKWDAEFIDKVGEKKQELYDLILAANYMDIKSLLHLGCAKVASMIKGQPLEKIKEILDPNAGAKAPSTAAAGSGGAASATTSAAGTTLSATAAPSKDNKDQKG